MNPESKVYLIIGLLIISSLLVTAGFSYVAFRAALRRSLNEMFRPANHGMHPGYWGGRPPRMPESSGLIPCQSLVDFTIAASTDESR